jgi:hypothetical protein
MREISPLLAELRPNASYTQLNAIPSRVEQDIFTVLWEMKKKGLRESTIRNTRKALSFLGRTVDLDRGEDVKGFIARIDKNESNKHSLSILITIMPRFAASLGPDPSTMLVANC